MDRYTKERVLKRRHSKSQTKSKKCWTAENLDFVAISAEFLGVSQTISEHQLMIHDTIVHFHKTKLKMFFKCENGNILLHALTM